MASAPRSSLVVLMLAAATAHAQWYQGSFWRDGAPVMSTTVEAGQPFSLEAWVQVYGVWGLSGYELVAEAHPALTFLSWADANGFETYVDYPWILGFAASGPRPFPPVFLLGTLTFVAPAMPGAYPLQMSPDSMLYDGDFNMIGGAWDSVVIFVENGGAGEGPGAPPAPPGYTMGPIFNGDFEASGGSLSGWTAQGYWPSEVGLYSADGSPDHSARLHAEGEWVPMPGPDPWMTEWSYSPGWCSVGQTVLIPTDATGLTFTYATRQSIQISGGTLSVTVQIGGTQISLAGSQEWTRITVPIPPAAKGRRSFISFSVSDGGYGWESYPPSTRNTADLYLDYTTIDGAMSAQTLTWSAPGGGSWGDPGNWNPAQVPGNSPAVAHDVLIPVATPAGGLITVSAPHTIQTLRDERRGDPLVLGAGASLHVVEDVWTKGAAVQISAGGAMLAEEDVSVEGGTLQIHPDGDPVGRTALTVGGRLLLDRDPLDSSAATLTIQDAVVQAANLTIQKANVSLVNSPDSAVQSVLAVTGNTYIPWGSQSTLSLDPNTTLQTRNLYVDGSSAAVNVQSATISLAGTGSGSATSYGTLSFSGPDCRVTGMSVYNYGGTLRLTDSTATLDRTLSTSGALRLVNSALIVEGSLTVSGAASADAHSSITFKSGFSNSITNPANCELTAAEIRYAGASASVLGVPGLNVGPFASGFENNYGIGTLVVASGTLQLGQTGSGHALYVRRLEVAPGATLDLNGVALYYLESTAIEGSVTSGDLLRAYPRPAGLPEPVLATDYIARAEACGEVQQVTGGPAVAYGYSGPNSSAESHVSVGTGVGYRTIGLDVAGWAYPDPWFPSPGLVDANGSFTGGFSLAATPQYPAGERIKVRFRAALSGYAGAGLSLSCTVHRGGELLATLGTGTPEAELELIVGETDLWIEAALADHTSEWGGDFNNHLQVMIYTIPTMSNADFNGDGAVDADDYAVLLGCTTGPGVPYVAAPPGCALELGGEGFLVADFDRDHDIDADDFAVFQRCYGGPARFVDVGCER